MTLRVFPRPSLTRMLSYEAAWRAYFLGGAVRERAGAPYGVEHVEPFHDVIIDTTCGDVASQLRQHRGGVTCCVRDVAMLAADASDLALRRASVVVISSRRIHGDLCDMLVARLRQRFPDLTIFVRSGRGDRANDLVSLAAAGADDVFSPELSARDGPLTVAIRRRALAPVPRRIVRETADALPEGPGRTIALWCLRNAYRKRSVADVARQFAIDRKTALRRCRDVGAPPVATLLRLGRLYHAAELRQTSFLS